MRPLLLLSLSLLLCIGCGPSTRLQGQVVDPAGRPVRPDRAFAVIDTPDPAGQPGEQKATIVSLDPPGEDGRFDYAVRGSRPRLSFRKEGWRELEVAFAGDAEDARLVMEPYPADMPILDLHASITFSPVGKDTVLDFDDPAPGNVGKYDEAHYLRRTRDDVTDPSQWPEVGVVLLADVTEEGEFGRVFLYDDNGDPVIHHGSGLQMASHFIDLRFAMTDGPRLAEGGGFQRYLPEAYRRKGAGKDKPSWLREFYLQHGAAEAQTYREMAVAPEEGYQPELFLTPEEQRQVLARGGYGWRLWFYFKTADGRYGKGYLEEINGGTTEPVGDPEGEPVPRLLAHVVMYVNPVPGDRRLDDGRAGWLEPDPVRPVNLPTTNPITQPATQPASSARVR